MFRRKLFYQINVVDIEITVCRDYMRIRAY